MNTTKHLTALEIDGMPAQVATAMLTEPKARLTNRMRKNCRAARQKVFISSSPIRKKGLTLRYTGIEPKDPEQRLVARIGRATWTQLNKWEHRLVTRRLRVQAKYEKLSAVTPKNPLHEKRLAAAKLMLAAFAQQLDMTWGVVWDEIHRRAKLTAGMTSLRTDARHINPQVRRRAALLRAFSQAACL